ncbi:MAG TPA: acyl--CoA ligase [Chloroflexota bacterium]|nr:acyl--CoA ligase [Chloroflexota bacterium]
MKKKALFWTRARLRIVVTTGRGIIAALERGRRTAPITTPWRKGTRLIGEQTPPGQIGDNTDMTMPATEYTLRAILAQAPGEATALIAPETERRWSYGALRSQVAALATQLAGVGIMRGDRVAIVLPNGPEIVAAFLAVVHGGAVAAPLNPAYTPDEFTFFFGDIQPRALIVAPGDAAAARATAPMGCRIVEAAIDDMGRLCFVGDGDGSGAVATPEPEDIALVLHTSGTTSRPKQVPLRHRNLLASARTIVESYQLTAADVSLCVMPLFHVHGLVASTLSALLAGGTVIAPARFSAGRFWQDAQRQGATWYSAVPTIHQILLARAGEDAPPAGATGLRFARSCSSALAPAVMQGLEQRLGVPVLEAYGMTEAAHQMASNPLPPARRVPGSVGLATGVQIGIMDQAGTLLPAGSAGEVVIRGESVTSGYHNNPQANVGAFTNGWFRTGDQGVLDEQGYLYLTGRLKEMILRGGENIAPREIDEVLLTHPAVAEAVTFGLPDQKYGEEVAAAVVLRHAATPEEIIAHCRARIAAFKAPKTIFITEQIPRTATGKIQRRIVAAAFVPER